MRRLSLTFCLLSSLAILAPGTSRAAVTAADFQLRNTGDLVALCSATSADPMATAAVHFCEGFGVGVTRVLQQEDAADPSRRPMFCLPGNMTRDQGVVEFVRWANADPSRLAMPATDGVAAFLAAQFPCARK
jgi:Rap1a immunity proteins